MKNILLLFLSFFFLEQRGFSMEERDSPRIVKKTDFYIQGGKLWRWTKLKKGEDFTSGRFGMKNETIYDCVFAGDLSQLDFSKVKRFYFCDFSLAIIKDKEVGANIFHGKELERIKVSGEIAQFCLKKASKITSIDLSLVPDAILLTSCAGLLGRKTGNNPTCSFFAGNISLLGLGEDRANESRKNLEGISFQYVPDFILNSPALKGLFNNKSCDEVKLKGDVRCLGLENADSFCEVDFSRIPDEILRSPEMKNILKHKNVNYAIFRGDISFLGLRESSSLRCIDLRLVPSEILRHKNLQGLLNHKDADHILFAGDIRQLGLRHATCLTHISLVDVPDDVLLSPELEDLFENKAAYGAILGGNITQLGLKKARNIDFLDLRKVPDQYFEHENLKNLYEGKSINGVKLKGNISSLGLDKSQEFSNGYLVEVDLSSYPTEFQRNIFLRARLGLCIAYPFSLEAIPENCQLGRIDLLIDLNKDAFVNEFLEKLLEKMKREDGKNFPQFSLILKGDLLTINLEILLKIMKDDTIRWNNKMIRSHKLKKYGDTIKEFKKIYEKYKKDIPHSTGTGNQTPENNSCDLYNLAYWVFFITPHFRSVPGSFFPETDTICKNIFIDALGFKHEILMQLPCIGLKHTLLNRAFMLYYSFPHSPSRPIRYIFRRLYSILEIKESHKRPDQYFMYNMLEILRYKESSLKTTLGENPEEVRIIEDFIKNPLLLPKETFLKEAF